MLNDGGNVKQDERSWGAKPNINHEQKKKEQTLPDDEREKAIVETICPFTRFLLFFSVAFLPLFFTSFRRLDGHLLFLLPRRPAELRRPPEIFAVFLPPGLLPTSNCFPAFLFFAVSFPPVHRFV